MLVRKQVVRATSIINDVILLDSIGVTRANGEIESGEKKSIRPI